MTRRLVYLLAAAAALLGLVPAGLAATSAVKDHVQVGVPGANDTADFSPNLYIALTAPPDYRPLVKRTWAGPPVVNNRGVGDDTSISWDVGYVVGKPNLLEDARSALLDNYPLVQGATILVPHFVAGRRAGTISGEFLISQLDARVEAAGAFPLGRGVVAVVSFVALNPANDNAAPFGTNTVKDKPASTWNREQVQAAILGVALEGSLPPARVTATPAAGGSLVLGNVLDAFGHPVAAATVRLVRGAKTFATGKTDGAGHYSLHARGRRATYRVVASLPRASRFQPPVSAVSKPIRAGR